MKTVFRLSVLAAAMSCTIATPVIAQDAEPTAEEELAAMRAQLQSLVARIDQLEGELAETKAENAAQDAEIAAATEAANAPAPEPAPAATLAKGDGWSFKPRGRLMYDAGTVATPYGIDGGFGNEVRRARLGASGDLPGGFGYKVELEFGGDELDVTDAYFSYESGDAEIIIGQHNNFQSLEELSSSLHTSFIERAAFTDAFGFERRIGVSGTYSSGILLAQAGIFTDNFEDTDTVNRSVDGRLVVMPKMGDTQLHFGGSLHHNELGQEDATVRYRQRPFVHFTSTRFVNTDRLDAQSEFGMGLEAAAISGPFHVAAEGFWQKVELSDTAADNPTFFGGYVEAGFFLTKGDTRGYKGGKFDRVKPSKPVGEGGAGSLQFNLRYDHLDLNDAGILGGKQAGYQASVIWKPTDYTLFSLNYGRMEYSDAVIADENGGTDYGVDAIGVRAQVDF